MAYSYAHMCRDGHIQIGHNDSADDEMCPLCRLLYAMAWMDDQDPQLVDAAMERFKIKRVVEES